MKQPLKKRNDFTNVVDHVRYKGRKNDRYDHFNASLAIIGVALGFIIGLLLSIRVKLG